jgi:HAD superfamily phosphatase (TIGR01668 family)
MIFNMRCEAINMIKKLQPKEMKHSIYDVNLEALAQKGYKYIIIDLDNTITPWNKNEISQELVDWILSAKKLEYKICLLSNSNYKRSQNYASQLEILSAPKGGKPFQSAFKRALNILAAEPENTVVIGDQIFTDILGGNRMNMYTILVDPLSSREFIGTKINRFLEKLLVRREQK